MKDPNHCVHYLILLEEWLSFDETTCRRRAACSECGFGLVYNTNLITNQDLIIETFRVVGESIEPFHPIVQTNSRMLS